VYLTCVTLPNQYYSNTPWPPPQAIASEANGHPLFLAVYRELTHRHWHSVRHPNVRDRIEGWVVYKELFDELLDEENISASEPPFYLLPEWTFDIMHEFVYQFQGFCQYWRKAANAQGQHQVENLTILAQNKESWAIEQVLYYLNRLVSVGKTSKVPGYQYFGIFASIALSRLECLLGDYSECLSAAAFVVSGDLSVKKDGETQNSAEIMESVFGARLSWAYHTGVSYLMLRRYKDALRTLGSICSIMQRGFKVRLLSFGRCTCRLHPTYFAFVCFRLGSFAS
jgi:translation initiation factor 3 subunit L